MTVEVSTGFRDPAVRIPGHEEAGTASVTIRHTARHTYIGSPAAQRGISPTLEHRFRLCLDDGDMPDAGLFEEVAAWWPEITCVRDRWGHDEYLVIGELVAEEYPAQWLASEGWSWSDVLGARADRASLLECLTAVRAQRAAVASTTERGDGSVYLMRQLDIHPAFRGWCLGARLLAHVTWAVRRCRSDVCLLIPHVIPERDPGSARRGRLWERDLRPEYPAWLVPYFERVGYALFQPCDGTAVTSDTVPVMWMSGPALMAAD